MAVRPIHSQTLAINLRRCLEWALVGEVQAANLSADSRTPFPMSKVNGLAAKCGFHSPGVSCATSRAGWIVRHIDQPGVRVHLVCATRRDKVLDDSDMFCAEFGPTEQPVPPSHRDPTARLPAHLAGCAHSSRPMEADPSAVATGPRRWSCTIAGRLRRSAPNAHCARRTSPIPLASSCGSPPRVRRARRSGPGPPRNAPGSGP